MSARIVVLTGAGVSAESGIGTFRDKDGLWAKIDWRDVATPEGFARDPARVLDFYNQRRAKVAAALPNAAHEALARLQRHHAAEVTLITQNVDDLHEKAGFAGVVHMHGQHSNALCAACGHRWPAPEVLDLDQPCPDCTATACRPDVVWFGEMPYHMETIQTALSQADIFAAIGTSGHVYPAAGFVRLARQSGAHCVEINLEQTARTDLFHQHLPGPATQTVPAWVDGLLG